MTRRKLKIPEFQNTKTKNFQNSYEEMHIPRFLTCENFKQKNWKLWNFKISKQKTFQVSKRKSNISTLVKLHTKKLKTPKMTRRKLKISNFQNKKKKNFQSSHAPFPHLWNFTQKNLKIPKLQNTKTKNTIFFLKTHKMTRRKIKDSWTSKYKNKGHNFFWRPTKWQEEKLETSELQNSKTKNS